jgi:hypothetical protein
MSWLKRLVGGKEAPAPQQQADAAGNLAAKPRNWSESRKNAFEELFGCEASKVFASSDLSAKPDDPILIDVLVFELGTETYGDIQIAVTNGMSDRRMVDTEDRSIWSRRELIQYFPKCMKEHAVRLRDMAWLPHHDGFWLDTCHTIAWEHPAVAGTPWSAAFFLEPLLRSHRDWEIEVEGDPVSLLWHIPISQAELQYKKEHGANALIERLEAVDLPWLFDEANRPPLVV